MRLKNRYFLPAFVGLSAFLGSAGAQAAITIHKTNFLTGYTHFNGFEAMGRQTLFPGSTGHTEQEITATYVGTPGVIMTWASAAQGRYSWYPNGGSVGYTALRFGGIIEAVAFQASTGFGPSAAPDLHYELLLGGVSIASGLAGQLATFGEGWAWYGFSGARFDELRLQARDDIAVGFDPAGLDSLMVDAIRFNGHWLPPEPPPVSGVPDSSSWALLLMGLGLTGVGLRRKARPHRHR